MKFSLATISAAILAISTVSGAAIIDKRQEPNQDPNQQDPSQDPNQQDPNQDPNQQQNATKPDIAALDGVWYLTGVTQNVWDAYGIVQKAMNIDINCPQFNVSQGGVENSFDVLISSFLTQNASDIGVNASAASVFTLQEGDSTANATDKEYLWTSYASQIFVNQGQWKNFTSNGKNTEETPSGSVAIPGTKPVEANIYTKFIDSNAEPGSGNAENIDTIFIWGTEAKFHDATKSKRADEVYGAILSKTSSIAEDVFNKTLALLPPQVVSNNVSLVLLDDSCKADNDDQNADQNNDQNADQANQPPQ
ncbi:hypothetical protein BDF21DRAFT_400431 [Thamnidium elegans]|uniref:Uncharacterized protein n=1 Tax=Thamnidium elegans TaxID=101142 RepID=A0A8H7VX59_9FUNG|nr:hypothetical protein INT48_005668 [Thamnidium elegans]KAI8076049.1 hypothetical protein BDF21DRAFT_400431 [Thamnidium elegans]